MTSPRSAVDPWDATPAYYDTHAREYFDRTVSADLTDLYRRVLSHVRKGGRILDAGCGSGRDLKVFRTRGFDAVGIDASTPLIELARDFSGATCLALRFEDVDFENEFDAVWACASLLHLPRQKLVPVLRRFHRALVPRGILFASFQSGTDEAVTADGRFFTYYSSEELCHLLGRAGFTVVDTWTTEDALSGRPGLRWLNVLARR